LKTVKAVIVLLILIFVLLPFSAILWINSSFLVDKDHNAVVSRRSGVVGVVGPGKHYKIPLIDHVTKFPSGTFTIESSEPEEFYLYTTEEIRLSYEIEWSICTPELAYKSTVNGDYSWLEQSVVRYWSPITMALLLNYDSKSDLIGEITLLDRSIRDGLQNSLKDRGVCVKNVSTKI